MRICVYGAASPTIDKKYIELVEKWDKKWQTVDIHLCLAVAVTV